MQVEDTHTHMHACMHAQRHFEEVLNVPSTVAEELLADVEDQATTGITEVTREEVERAVSKLKNDKATGSD